MAPPTRALFFMVYDQSLSLIYFDGHYRHVISLSSFQPSPNITTILLKIHNTMMFGWRIIITRVICFTPADDVTFIIVTVWCAKTRYIYWFHASFIITSLLIILSLLLVSSRWCYIIRPTCAMKTLHFLLLLLLLSRHVYITRYLPMVYQCFQPRATTAERHAATSVITPRPPRRYAGRHTRAETTCATTFYRILFVTIYYHAHRLLDITTQVTVLDKRSGTRRVRTRDARHAAATQRYDITNTPHTTPTVPHDTPADVTIRSKITR